MITTGEIITKYLNEKNINQYFLARAIEVTPQYVNGIVRNKRSISENVLNKIAKFLRITSNDIELIKKYEIFKKTGLIKNNSLEIKIKGLYTENGYIHEIKEGIISLDNLGEKYLNTFIVEVLSYNLKNFSYGDMLIIKEINENFLNQYNKYLLINIDDVIDFCKIEKIDEKFLVTYLDKNKSKKIFKNNKKINIIGTIIGKYSLWKDEYE
ncbi:helix-turn-helix transcriptional regulator [Streptobacillus felis]|uniref:helix-turn-helix transcriptional regulator n=1 Tax=Streptobacillus felis TaxID=1384509 RepID=UPI000834C754|nr:helix-turn-helix transcriptional regulator [Streptobacillus felis]